MKRVSNRVIHPQAPPLVQVRVVLSEIQGRMDSEPPEELCLWVITYTRSLGGLQIVFRCCPEMAVEGIVETAA